MTNTNKTDIVYWLKQIAEALGADTESAAVSEINKTDIVFWLEGIAKILGQKTVTVGNITEMTNDQLDGLQVGDTVVKVTGNQKHLYLVTYKGEGDGEGICLTYTNAGYGETVSYDRTEDGWAYNSTDIKTYGDDNNDELQ